MDPSPQVEDTDTSMARNELPQCHVDGFALGSSTYQLLSFMQNAVVDVYVRAHTPKHTHQQVYLKLNRAATRWLDTEGHGGAHTRTIRTVCHA